MKILLLILLLPILFLGIIFILILISLILSLLSFRKKSFIILRWKAKQKNEVNKKIVDAEWSVEKKD